MITFKDWKSGTGSVFTTGRSDELKAVGDAFQTFENAKGDAAKATAKTALTNAFNAWKRTQGPGDEWLKSKRNTSRAMEKLAAMLGSANEETAFSRGKAPDYMHEELVNARLGVLYLFSRLNVTPGLFKMLLEGGLDLAGQGLDVGGASDTVQDVFGKGQKGYSAAQSKIDGKLDQFERGFVKQVAVKNVNLPVGQAPSIDLTPKPAVVTSTGLLAASSASRTLSNPTLEAIRVKLETLFDSFVEKVKQLLQKKFGTIEDAAGTIKQLVKALVSLIASKAAPFVGSGLDIVKSCATTLDASYTRFRTWKEGRDVEMAQGHPTTVVDSITRAMNVAVFSGLYDMLKGAGALAMDITAFGAGGLVNLIISAIELIVKFVWRLAETIRFNKFCAMAREYYENSKSADSIHKHPFAFADWYRSYALNLPLIAILTLNTGICGDKMRYLTMFNNGAEISTESFQAGVRFLDNLKPWGAQYIQDAGFDIRSVGDPWVNSLVNTFAVSHSREKTTYDKVIGILKA
jgi:hypothetical protein